MKNLSLDEVEVIQRIARDASCGGSFQERITELVGALSVLIPAGTVTAFVLEDGRPSHALYWNGNPELLLGYANHYRQFDPMGCSIEDATGRPMLLSDRVSTRAFGRDPYTSDMLMPLSVRWIMGVTQRLANQSRVAIALQREQSLGDFTTKERELLRLVTPDLARATFSAVLQEKVAASATLPAGPGGLLFDDKGDLVHADERALTLLRRLITPRQPVGETLRAVVRSLLTGPGPHEGRGTTCVLPAAAGPVLRASLTAVKEGSAPLRVLAVIDEVASGSTDYFNAAANRIGLTEREREIATLALQGQGNRGIAHQLKMSESTVKFHLANVFKKSGAPGKTELFHVLMGVSPPV